MQMILNSNEKFSYSYIYTYVPWQTDASKISRSRKAHQLLPNASTTPFVILIRIWAIYDFHVATLPGKPLENDERAPTRQNMLIRPDLCFARAAMQFLSDSGCIEKLQTRRDARELNNATDQKISKPYIDTLAGYPACQLPSPGCTDR